MDDIEKALIKSEARFRDLFDSTKNAIAIYEPYNDGEDFIIKDFNRSAERIENVKREDIIGRKVTEVFPGVKEFGLFDVFYRVWKTGVSEEHPISFYKDERHRGWRENYVLRLSSGEIVAIYNDVTEQKLAEQTLRESERKYSFVVNNSFDGIWIIDENIHITFVNKRMADMLGYQPEEIVGKPTTDFFFEEDLPDHRKQIKNRRKGMSAIYERRLRRKDGSTLWTLVSGTPMFDEENRFKGSFAFFTDITERKLAEEALRESEKKYSLMINSANEGICLLDKDEKITFANKRLSEMSGYSLEEMMGKPASYFIYEEDLSDHEKQMQDRRKGLASRYERRLRRKDGSTLWTLISGTPILDENNRFFGSLVMITDITKQKQNEKMLEAYNRILEITNKHIELEPLLNEVVNEAREIINCSSVGIRVFDEKGDIIHNVCVGFSPNFHKPDDLLSLKRCMCFKVISGTTDNSLPYFTEYGSFYCSSITELLKTFSEENLSCFKNQNDSFYESGAIIPIRVANKAVALVYIADTEKNKITSESISLIEKIIIELGQAIERIRSADALFKERELLDVTLRSIGDAVISTDSEGRIAIINNVAEKLTGWTEREAIGRHISEVFNIINEKTRQSVQNPVEKVISSGRVIGLANHTVLISRNGTEYSIADSGAPIYSRDGRIIGVVIVFRDVTEERKMEAELQKINKLESLGILAGGIAHDFNNILTSILGNLSLARLHKNEEEKERRLEEAEKATMTATGLTQQLLTFAKGGLPIKKLGSIKDLLRDSTEFVLRGTNVRPIFSMQDDLWNIEMDESQIDRVIQNIVINAVQAMPEGGAIWISAENVYLHENPIHSLDEGKYVKLSIKDSGMGIPREHLGRIFEPYFTTKQKGSGLGLAICYSIIKNHGGYIEVESELGVGSNFVIYLPASDKDVSEKKIELEPSIVKSKGKVLVMDDEESIRDVMKSMLEEFSGYEVFTAKDGLEAVNLYKQEMDSGRPFDAVILDLTVPGGMGGKETMQELLEIDPNVKAIVYSGYSNDPIMSNYREYGFKEVIVKPFKIKELSEILCRVIS